MPEMYVMEVSVTESSAAQEIPTSTLKVLNISLEKRDRMRQGGEEGNRERGGERESDWNMANTMKPSRILSVLK